MADEKPVVDEKRCFVIMGFGVKTDLATGRKLNLDKSYQALIKPVVESHGIKCYRADEIPNSGSIDMPMFKELYTSDIVIADLSTANVNAFYELGIRHALRPRTTIIISEDQFCPPFDINHVNITKYTHLGDSIDYFEVLRFQKELGKTIDALLNDNTTDSPVYTFLDDLIPPALQAKAQRMAQKVNEALANAKTAVPGGDVKNDETKQTLAIIIKKGEEAITSREYEAAIGFFKSALLLSNCNLEMIISPNNAYLVHRLALATYKAEKPDKKSALIEANKLLNKLDLSRTNDTETIILGGAVEKKLYEIGESEEHLSNAIELHQRAFFLLNNRYNGINLAYLLNCRTVTILNKTSQENIADMIWANRLRQYVLNNCEREWKMLTDKTSIPVLKKNKEGYEFARSQAASENEQKFWILANKAEANFGLGNFSEYEKAKSAADSLTHTDWMMKGFTKQIDELGKILDKTGYLLSPEWKRP